MTLIRRTMENIRCRINFDTVDAWESTPEYQLKDQQMTGATA